MNELILNTLAAEINATNDALEASMGQTLRYAAVIGQKLNEVKEFLPHGEFVPWLENNCHVKKRQAQKYMKLAKEMPDLLDSKAQSTALLGFEAAFELLTAPEEVKEQVNDKLEAGEAVTVKQIAELKKENEALKWQAELAEREAEELAETLTRTEQEIDQLKASEQTRLESMTKELRLKLKESEEMAQAVREQRDRILEDERKGKALLQKRLEQESAERKAAMKAHQKALEEAKQAAEDGAVIARKAELDEIERRLAMTKERLSIKQAEVDRITHMNLLHNESDKAIQVIDQAIMTISIQLSTFLDTVHEYSGDPAQIDIENWEKVVRNYSEGQGAMNEVLRILRKQTALPNLTAVKGWREA